MKLDVINRPLRGSLISLLVKDKCTILDETCDFKVATVLKLGLALPSVDQTPQIKQIASLMLLKKELLNAGVIVDGGSSHSIRVNQEHTHWGVNENSRQTVSLNISLLLPVEFTHHIAMHLECIPLRTSINTSAPLACTYHHSLENANFIHPAPNKK